ncbi:MAG: acyl carrier protein [Labilithrix sp.]|nr:acyl carrier protein [Labilithrix sp.]
MPCALENLPDAIVQNALACHLRTPEASFDAALELERDLGLDPLDLVLIALGLEEAVGVEFPVALLEGVRTVGDVARLVSTWLGVVPALRRATCR